MINIRRHAIRVVAAMSAVATIGAVGLRHDADAAPATRLDIDFSSAGAPIPAGATADTGAAFSATRAYGWTTATGTAFENSAGSRTRSGVTDPRWAGFVHAYHKTSGQNLKWEHVVSNGIWDVTVGVGDANYFDSTHVVNVEGQRVINAVSTNAAAPYAYGAKRVTVLDGRLTLDVNGGTNTKPSWLQATLVTTDTNPAPAGNIVWMYKPPSDGTTAATLASKYGAYILSPRDEPYRDDLVARGERQPYMYFRFDVIIDAGTAQPRRSQAAYNIGDFASISATHPDWFLRDAAGNRIYDSGPDGREYLMDPGNAGWRNYFLDRLRSMYVNNGWRGGVMLDNVETGLRKRDRLGEVPFNYADDIAYTGAIEGMLRHIDTSWAAAAGVPLTANMIEGGYTQADLDVRARYGRWLDGMVLENFAVTWKTGTWLGASSWNHELKRFEDSVARGDEVIVYAQGDKTDTARQRFAFASYLLVKANDSAFRYSRTGASYGSHWWYSNYDLRIGMPLGPRYQSGSTWRRDYTNGTVVVDPTAHTASITVTA